MCVDSAFSVFIPICFTFSPIAKRNFRTHQRQSRGREKEKRKQAKKKEEWCLDVEIRGVRLILSFSHAARTVIDRFCGFHAVCGCLFSCAPFVENPSSTTITTTTTTLSKHCGVCQLICKDSRTRLHQWETFQEQWLKTTPYYRFMVVVS